MHPGNKFSQLGAATVGVTVFFASRAFLPMHCFASSFESPAAERWPGLSFSFSSSESITMQSTCFCMKCAYLQQVQRQGRASFVIKASVARQAVSMRFFFSSTEVNCVKYTTMLMQMFSKSCYSFDE